MALIWGSSPPSHFLHTNPHPTRFPFQIPPPSLCLVAVRATGTEGGSRVGRRDAFRDSAPLRRPPPLVSAPVPAEDEREAPGNGGKKPKQRAKAAPAEEEWVDWEDQILEDTVPLVGFVRMILHSGKYSVGDRLTPEHEKAITERLLPYHPQFEKKIGCGIDYIIVGFHPEFEDSKCLFIVRKDGESVDFSYWKCIKGLIKKKYPLYADSFILRHFRRRRKTD